jgi:two-component system, chemotaxis family, response regulator Rcp1
MSDAVIEILLVEDNPGDARLTKEAMKASGIEARVDVVGNGEDAMRFLCRQQPFSQAPRPDVLVLDLNLPGKNGHEVLLEVASDPALNTIPVAILTGSKSETCVCETYPPGRCLYFVKTPEFRELQEIVRQIAALASEAG